MHYFSQVDSAGLLKVKKDLINEYIRKQGCSDWDFQAVGMKNEMNLAVLFSAAGFKWTLWRGTLVHFFRRLPESGPHFILIYIMCDYI